MQLDLYVLTTQGKGSPEVNHRGDVGHTWLHRSKGKSYLDWSQHMETILATFENTQEQEKKKNKKNPLLSESVLHKGFSRLITKHLLYTRHVLVMTLTSLWS